MIEINDERLLTDTPFVAVDLDRLERNIRRMAELSASSGVKLRPHAKTHKSPWIAGLQLAAGARGITVAKLGEAEVMVDAGVKDVLIAFPIIGKEKLRRFASLMERATLTVAIDDHRVAVGLNEVGTALGRPIPVYVDVDTGLHRMGRAARDSVDEVMRMAEQPFVEIRGLTSHAGHAYRFREEAQIEAVAVEDAQILYETRQQLLGKGLEIPEISVGATATARFISGLPHVTEMRPGMYVYNDRTVMGAGGAKQDDCAARVVATIVARPEKNRFVMDAGSKTLSNDLYGHGPGYGLVVGHPELQIEKLSEEHGVIISEGACALEIGDVIQIIPNHICPVINLTDFVYGFRRGRLEMVIEVAARGRNR